MRAFRLLDPSPSANGWRCRDRALVTALGIAGAVGTAWLPAAAQEPTGAVAGKVTAADVGTPLAGATVFVTGAQTGAYTRSDGTFRIPLRPGTYELRVRYIGWTGVARYRRRHRRADHDQELRSHARPDHARSAGGYRNSRRGADGDRLPRSDRRAHVGRTSSPPGEPRRARSCRCSRRRSTSRGRRSPTAPTHVRPATLRGLGPDQVLVLINGKRRHNSALVNVNGTVGRGSTGVDLNAIPASMIERIEVLRDGAAAQYGLGRHRGRHQHRPRSRAPRPARPARTFGHTLRERWLGDAPRADAGSVVRRSPTMCTSASSTATVARRTAQASTRGSSIFSGDPRNDRAVSASTLPTGRRRDDGRAGHAQRIVHDAAVGSSFYAFGGASHRDGEAAANWRLPNGNNTVRRDLARRLSAVDQDRHRDVLGRGRRQGEPWRTGNGT